MTKHNVTTAHYKICYDSSHRILKTPKTAVQILSHSCSWLRTLPHLSIIDLLQITCISFNIESNLFNPTYPYMKSHYDQYSMHVHLRFHGVCMWFGTGSKRLFPPWSSLIIFSTDRLIQCKSINSRLKHHKKDLLSWCNNKSCIERSLLKCLQIYLI